jgi:nicotinamidase-related amidase
VHPFAGILENANKLIAAFRNAELRIIFVNVNQTNSPLNIVRKDAPSPKRDFDDA